MINWTQLDTHNAFNIGQDLWFLGLDQSSPIYQRLDWLLNFQIYNSKLQHKAELPLQLKEILDQCEISETNLNTNFSKTKHSVLKPTLIPASKNVPAKWVVLFEPLENKIETTDHLIQLWNSFSKPSCRFFLTNHYKLENFKNSWELAGLVGEATIYIDV